MRGLDIVFAKKSYFSYIFCVFFINYYYLCNLYITTMVEVKIKDSSLAAAAQEGIDAFLNIIINCTREAIGGELTSENMSRMSSDQITLMGYAILRDELMDGGFVQLIHNGYGGFFFRNPFDTAVREWGLLDLCHLMRHVKKIYKKNGSMLEQEYTEEEFMALYEQYPEYEDYDDDFVTHEEEWSKAIARYVDEHLEDFVVILDN